MTLDVQPLFLAEILAFDASLGITRTLCYASGNGYTTGPTAAPANTYYDGRIMQAVDVTRTMFSGGNTQGDSRMGVGDLVLLNGDGLLDDLLQYGFDGRRITVWRSTVLDPEYPNDFDTVFVGTMARAEFTNETVTIKLRDRLYELSAPLQTNKFAGTNVLPVGLEGVATDLQGKPKPLCYGAVSNISPPCVNTSTLTYQVHDGQIAAVAAVYDKGATVTAGADFATSALLQAASPGAGTFVTCLAEGYFRLGSSPAGLITADVTQGASTARTAAQIYSQLLGRATVSNPNATQIGFAQIVASSGESFVADDGALFVASDSVSESDIVALDLANAAVLGLYVENETTILDACDLVANSVGAWWGVDQAGTFRIAQFTRPTGAAVVKITANDLLVPITILATNDNGDGLPVWRSTVRWGQSYTVQSTDLASGVSNARRAVVAQQWRSAVASDTTIQQSNILAPETIEDSLLTTAADAQAEANRRLALREVRRDRYELVVPLTPETSPIDLNDVIELAHPRFGLSVVGSDTGSLFRVVDVQPDAKAGRLSLTVWGRGTSRNITADDGALFVCDDGTYLITNEAA